MAEQTIFHKIMSKEIPAQIVFEDSEIIAFRDVNPVSKVHVLVVPKRTIPKLSDAKPEDEALLGRMLLTASEIARREGVGENFRVAINNGPGAGQSVFQLHMHVMGGRSFEWPPG